MAEQAFKPSSSLLVMQALLPRKQSNICAQLDHSLGIKQFTIWALLAQASGYKTSDHHTAPEDGDSYLQLHFFEYKY
jgi:hypothetical protein